jgi:hypothetical protein|tara:strand:+ start:555 stop:704 length:150 start_codon:yes stop_codon:yes gene_type:complete
MRLKQGSKKLFISGMAVLPKPRLCLLPGSLAGAPKMVIDRSPELITNGK